MSRLIELDDGKIGTGKPFFFDGKNPWVSGEDFPNKTNPFFIFTWKELTHQRYRSGDFGGFFGAKIGVRLHGSLRSADVMDIPELSPLR